MSRTELISRYGAVDGPWLDEKIHAFWDADAAAWAHECVDNVRLARTEDAAEMSAYEMAEREGCCGNYNETFGPSPTGFYYLYGFNYGH